MSTETLSVWQYAKQRKKCSKQAVLKAIKHNKRKLLPDVIDWEKIGSYYVLTVAKR